MSRKVCSISLPEDLKTWIDEQEGLNLSQIVQSSIRLLQENQNKGASTKENELIRERLAAVMKKMNQFRDFIEKEGLLDKYLKEVEGI